MSWYAVNEPNVYKASIKNTLVTLTECLLCTEHLWMCRTATSTPLAIWYEVASSHLLLTYAMKQDANVYLRHSFML